MKALLICPAERVEVSALAETMPLVNLSILGTPLICRWLEHLAGCGTKEVAILASDRPNQVRDLVGDGSRWGLRVNVIPEADELTPTEAENKFCSPADHETPLQVIRAVVMDHPPEFPELNIFTSYSAFFAAAQFLLLAKSAGSLFSAKEIQPGVRVGLRSQISPHAIIQAPCWIGANVLIKANAEIGPGTVIESGVIIESGASVSQSWIAENTFVGELTHVHNSLVSGNVLVNYALDSFVKISDPFLLGTLTGSQATSISSTVPGRIAALLILLVTLPFALVTMLKARWNGQRIFRARRAAAPASLAHGCSAVIYHEFATVNDWWKRWPQLWTVACGQFAWVGNRPITPLDAGKLFNDFEKLWLVAPIGLISQGDAEGCPELHSDEARAHAAFYATQANWRLNFQIVCRALIRLSQRNFYESPSSTAGDLKSRRLTLVAR